MILFCPRCGNMMVLSENSADQKNKFKCVICFYQYSLTSEVSFKTHPKLKQIDDVLGGNEAWQNVDSTQAKCKQCGHERAYFMQIQTRSADEPMTTFYRCSNCSYRWKES